MNTTAENVTAVVLAAGKGVRMNSELPKVLHLLRGRPLVHHVVDAIRGAGIDLVTVVVGYGGDRVIESIGDSVVYAWQREQRGTGHAVMQAEGSLRDFSGLVYVACGDAPLISSKTIRRMVAEAQMPGVKAVVLTMKPDNPFGYGRIVKDANGNCIRIVEEKDASTEEKSIREVNTGTYVFHSDCLFPGLKTITTENAQGEYYLPDVISFIRSSGYSIRTVLLDDPVEGSGVNSPEELRKLEQRLKESLYR